MEKFLCKKIMASQQFLFVVERQDGGTSFVWPSCHEFHADHHPASQKLLFEEAKKQTKNATERRDVELFK